MRAGHGDHARVGVDREPAAGVVVQRVGDRVVRGVRVAGRAVTPTAVPTAAFSSTALAAASLSVTAPTSNSSTSLIVDRERPGSVLDVSVLVARTVML